MRVESIFGLGEPLHILDSVCTQKEIRLEVETQSSQASCPLCSEPSSRIHSRYTRTLNDLPAAGKSIQLTVHLRRFRCLNEQCSGKIFCERIPQLAAPYAHCTERLQQAQTDIARAAGGEAGARLSKRLAMTISADTLLRRLKRLSVALPTEVTHVGVDDWAFRKGSRYGTIIVDLNTHRPIDVLPDRTSSTLTKWLSKHPSIQVISRDRAGEYAKAATQGAPNAIQVADRWHLLQNARQCL